MSKIALLSQETIDKIAAGEVVERPSSVVKELVENAIDAGASAITMEIKEGGISLIRITDNGCGIPKEEVPLAFLRHSTSKIRSAEDLMCVHSLGFRGEALSSIAAVSRVEMITKPADALTGTRYVIEGSKEIADEEIGAPDGTTFLVRDLFYNTPARRKFLKSPLQISKLQVFNPALGVSLKKSVLQPGETTRLRVTIDKRNIAKKKRHLRILMITNDPMQPKVEMNIKAS